MLTSTIRLQQNGTQETDLLISIPRSKFIVTSYHEFGSDLNVNKLTFSLQNWSLQRSSGLKQKDAIFRYKTNYLSLLRLS